MAGLRVHWKVAMKVVLMVVMTASWMVGLKAGSRVQ